MHVEFSIIEMHDFDVVLGQSWARLARALPVSAEVQATSLMMKNLCKSRINIHTD